MTAAPPPPAAPATACRSHDPVIADQPDEALTARWESDHSSVVGVSEFLGKGYRGWQYYANPRSVTVPIFDVGDRRHVRLQQAPSVDARVFSGSSRQEFVRSLSVNVGVSGSHGLFSGEFEASFSSDGRSKTTSEFAVSDEVHTYYRLSLVDDVPMLPGVIDDLSIMEPVALFEKYGTHVLRSVFVGARVAFSSWADTSVVSQRFDMSASVKASYAAMVRGEAGAAGVDAADLEQVSRNSQTRIEGGAPELAAPLLAGGTPEAHARWAASIAENPSIADFDLGGLVPIYELAPEDRAVELRAAWDEYMAEHVGADPEEDDPGPPAVHRNSTFRLVSADGRSVGATEHHWGWAYRYAKLVSGGVNHRFGGDGEPLVSGNIVSIKTTEAMEGGWTGMNKLGAFADKTELYYWYYYDSKSNWFIEKVGDPSDAQIRFGDKVQIRNEFYGEQYLTPHTNNFLTTSSKGQPHQWTIMPQG